MDTPDNALEPMVERPEVLSEGLQINLPLDEGPPFEGPLDLLLHLVRKQQIPIESIPLARLTAPYLAYLDQMQQVNLDISSDFLNIASILIWLKSKSLLPVGTVPEDDPEDEMAEEVLRARLIEYRLYRDVANWINQQPWLGREVFSRLQVTTIEAKESLQFATADLVAEEPVALYGIELIPLMDAMRHLLEQRAMHKPHPLPVEPLPNPHLLLKQILDTFCHYTRPYFQLMVADLSSRMEQVYAFLLILELVRIQAIRIEQISPNDPIYCQLCTPVSKEDPEQFNQHYLQLKAKLYL